MSDLIFIEASGLDAASTLMLAVSQKREEGYGLLSGLVPAVRDTYGAEGQLESSCSSLGQWMDMRGGILAPQYKLVRASTASVLQEAVRVLVNEGWDMHEATVFADGKYLQWMSHPTIWRAASEKQELAEEPVYSVDA